MATWVRTRRFPCPPRTSPPGPLGACTRPKPLRRLLCLTAYKIVPPQGRDPSPRREFIMYNRKLTPPPNISSPPPYLVVVEPRHHHQELSTSYALLFITLPPGPNQGSQSTACPSFPTAHHHTKQDHHQRTVHVQHHHFAPAGKHQTGQVSHWREKETKQPAAQKTRKSALNKSPGSSTPWSKLPLPRDFL